MPAALVTPMLIGAAVGAVSAAVQGGNILKGALFGALGGAVGGAITSAFGGAGGAAAGAATGGVMPPNPFAGAAGAAAEGAGGSTMFGGFAGDASAAGYGVTEGGAGMADLAPAASSGGSSAGGGVSMAAPSGIGSELSEFSYESPGGYSGMADTSAPTTLMQATGAGSGSETFLDSLFKSGKSMLNSRMGNDLIGGALKGWAAGKQQESMLEWKQKQIEDERRNSRFGNVGSRYNTSSMIGPATYSK